MKRILYLLFLTFTSQYSIGQSLDPAMIQILAEIFQKTELQKYRVEYFTDETKCSGNFIVCGDRFEEKDQMIIADCVIAMSNKSRFFYDINDYFWLDITSLDEDGVIRIEGTIHSASYPSNSTIRVLAELDDKGIPSIKKYRYN